LRFNGYDFRNNLEKRHKGPDKRNFCACDGEGAVHEELDKCSLDEVEYRNDDDLPFNFVEDILMSAI
jgi:hypothetical protein